MTKSKGNNSAEFHTRKQSEWVVDQSDASMTINHRPTGLTFWFAKDGSLKPIVNFSGNEDHHDFQLLFDEAIQIAEDISSTEKNT